MAIKRVVDVKIANERTYEKLKRDLDVLPPAHRDRARIQREMNEVKAWMAARRP